MAAERANAKRMLPALALATWLAAAGAAPLFNAPDELLDPQKAFCISQGCADVGICYAPLEQVVRVRLPGGRSE
jgi:hypothetical protein